LWLFETEERRAAFVHQVVTGLIHVWETTPDAAELRNLSLFHVFLREGNSASLVVTDSVDASPDELQRWMAPELLSEAQSDASEATLVYGVGLLLWELQTGTLPLQSLEGPVLLYAAQHVQDRIPTGNDTPLWDLIKSCVAADADDRMGLQQLGTQLWTIAYPPLSETDEKSAGEVVAGVVNASVADKTPAAEAAMEASPGAAEKEAAAAVCDQDAADRKSPPVPAAAVGGQPAPAANGDVANGADSSESEDDPAPAAAVKKDDAQKSKQARAPDVKDTVPQPAAHPDQKPSNTKESPAGNPAGG
jgi:hypothetical protein